MSVFAVLLTYAIKSIIFSIKLAGKTSKRTSEAVVGLTFIVSFCLGPALSEGAFKLNV